MELIVASFLQSFLNFLGVVVFTDHFAVHLTDLDRLPRKISIRKIFLPINVRVFVDSHISSLGFPVKNSSLPLFSFKACLYFYLENVQGKGKGTDIHKNIFCTWRFVYIFSLNVAAGGKYGDPHLLSTGRGSHLSEVAQLKSGGHGSSDQAFLLPS